MEIEKTGSVVVIDGSNAASGGGFLPPRLGRISETAAAVAAKFPSARVVVVVDANLRHALNSDDAAELLELCRTGQVVSAPARTVGSGDRVVLELAAALGALIVSNDCFAAFVETYPFLLQEGRVFGIVALDDLPVVLVPRQLGAPRVTR